MLHSESTIHTKVRGVSFRNNDGSHRQDIIRRRCRRGYYLHLEREPHNPHDKNAVAIYCEYSRWFGGKKRKQVGYLSKDLARQFHKQVEAGQVTVRITEITGQDFETTGVNIMLAVRES